MTVTDECASDQIYSSFEQLKDTPLKFYKSTDRIIQYSWSVIVVGFIPAYDQYVNDKIEEKRRSDELYRIQKEKMERERQEKEQRELEKI